MIYLSIGSNLNSKFGDRFENIRRSLKLLENKKLKILKVSRFYETPSWPDIKKPKFINVVVQSDTKFSPKKLIDTFKIIEKMLGRKKDIKNSPRTCDIDIICYYKKIIKGNISIPHEKMHKRNFVLIPLYELNKNWFHPKLKNNIKKLIFSLSIKDIRSIKQI